MKTFLSITSIAILFLTTACTGEKQKESITEGGMKCGPGKCGASMVDGSAVLVKKKMNILNQLPESDDRRECVLSAESTKALYNCVRDKESGRLTTKCSLDKTVGTKSTAMKCEAGKCSGGKNIPQKASSQMKCEAGKCGASM